MKKYCFCMTGNEVWFEVAKNLYEHNVAEPVLWLGDDRHFEKAKALFDNNVVKMLDFVHYQENIQTINYSGERLDFFLSQNYLRAKDRCLKMMDRLDLYGAFGRNDREAVFNKLCIWFLDKIEAANPDAFVFAETPHSHAQYLLFEVADFLGIRAVKFCTWQPAPLLFLQDLKTNEKIPKKDNIRGKYFKLLDQDVETYIQKIIDEMDDNENYEVPYMKAQRETTNISNRIKNFIKAGAWLLLKEFIFQFRKNLSRNYYKINPFKFGFFQIVKINRLRKKALLSQSIKHKDPFKKDEKYVYFALHFEPERTTNPDGGVFHDQILAILALRKILPKDTYIYVKEHPSQFYVANKGSRGRSPLFYELIKNLDKVKFVGFEENSLELIKHSIFVSTISGSVALEASVIGKKSLIFGDIWFKGCPNVFSWSNNLTYDQIIKSETFGHEDVLKFLKKEKEDFAVAGCQNISGQNRYKYSKEDDFLEEEITGVQYLLELFFKSI